MNSTINFLNNDPLSLRIVDSFTKNNYLTLLALCNAVSKPMSYSIPFVLKKPAVFTIGKFSASFTLINLVSDF